MNAQGIAAAAAGNSRCAPSTCPYGMCGEMSIQASFKEIERQYVRHGVDVKLAELILSNFNRGGMEAPPWLRLTIHLEDLHWFESAHGLGQKKPRFYALFVCVGDDDQDLHVTHFSQVLAGIEAERKDLLPATDTELKPSQWLDRLLQDRLLPEFLGHGTWTPAECKQHLMTRLTIRNIKELDKDAQQGYQFMVAWVHAFYQWKRDNGH